MHLTDVKRGFLLGTSGIVGAGIPHAAGAGLGSTDSARKARSCIVSSATARRSKAHSTRRSTLLPCGSAGDLRDGE